MCNYMQLHIQVADEWCFVAEFCGGVLWQTKLPGFPDPRQVAVSAFGTHLSLELQSIKDRRWNFPQQGAVSVRYVGRY